MIFIIFDNLSDISDSYHAWNSMLRNKLNFYFKLMQHKIFSIEQFVPLEVDCIFSFHTNSWTANDWNAAQIIINDENATKIILTANV